MWVEQLFRLIDQSHTITDLTTFFFLVLLFALGGVEPELLVIEARPGFVETLLRRKEIDSGKVTATPRPRY